MRHCYYSLHIVECYTDLDCYTHNDLATVLIKKGKKCLM